MKITRAKIEEERVRQDEKWGGPSHDDRHTSWEWKSYICNHAWKGNLLEVAALGFAIADALDRAQIELAKLYGEVP